VGKKVCIGPQKGRHARGGPDQGYSSRTVEKTGGARTSVFSVCGLTAEK